MLSILRTGLKLTLKVVAKVGNSLIPSKYIVVFLIKQGVSTILLAFYVLFLNA